MEKFTPYYVVQCIRPNCRFRYPASSDPGSITCPKCGSPVQTKIFSIPDPDNSSTTSTPQKIEVLIDNLRSAYNTGSILRTSDAVKISHIHLCGTTPTPDNVKVIKTALGAEFSTPWSLHWNALDTVIEHKRQGFFIVCLEISPGAVSIFDLQSAALQFPLLLVVGNEVTGVDPEILTQSMCTVQIPMLGKKGSINVATAFGIAVYFLRYLEGKLPIHP